MSLNLLHTMERIGLTQKRLAQSVVVAGQPVSAATINLIAKRNQWPKSWPKAEVRDAIREVLSRHGATQSELIAAFAPAPNTTQEKAEQRANAARPVASPQSPVPITEPQEIQDMLLRKQSLTPVARKHFNLFRDPFAEVDEREDVFLSPDIRYVRESLWATAKHGGFLAVIGESGAGKTTLKRDLADRIHRESAPVILIEPYVLAMEDNDQKGKTLKSGHIAEAILACVAPLERPKSSPEARFRQIHQVLRDSARSGHKHLLLIEEAHGLPTATLKHLKRFLELEDGFKKLLSVVLVGQPELRLKLSERNLDVREVVQRCEVVELTPLDNHLPAYLKFRFEKVGAEAEKCFEPTALDALREKLTFARRGATPKEAERVSLLYPLAVNNVATAALNMAAQIGAPRVTGQLIQEV